MYIVGRSPATLIYPRAVCVEAVWEQVAKHFETLPGQARVAQLLIRHGLRVENGIRCGPIEVPDTAIGRAVGVDRRVVTATRRTIERNKSLKRFFGNLSPICSLKDVAADLGWGVIEIIPRQARSVGILAGVTSIIAKANISIRQVVVADDPEYAPGPRAYIVTEIPVPARSMEKIRRVPGVSGVVVH